MYGLVLVKNGSEINAMPMPSSSWLYFFPSSNISFDKSIEFLGLMKFLLYPSQISSL